ncbi:MAG: glycoside hydrolase family 38 C-terminal domain-containing protein [Thermoanaerobacter sp.]|uniref:glycoside hydrolase family 38 N-terminal domain-containing protein n=1 Tax=Thermoanaerobacter sp. TaxID=1755 RepID=UPI00346395D8
MKTIHLISHTHWDREWHMTFQEFRVLLVYVIDNLLDIMEKDNEFKYFILDGQTVVLEDYLEIKPENKERLIKLIKDGRIFVGPWYTQPDVFLVSGESLIRNLLIGRDIANRFGRCMNVAYLPDSFGQSSQIPQIIKGFGINSIVIWRGVSRDEIDEALFLWEGEDGSKILTLHLPLGYGYNRYLPEDINKALEYIIKTTKNIENRFKNDNIIFMSGSDHAHAQESMPKILGRINKLLMENNYNARIIQSNFEKFFEEFNSDESQYKIVKGELRNPKDMRIHAGITSTRMDIKYLNKQQEIIMEKYFEPLATFGYLLGMEYPKEIINKAWKILLQNHSHDSICCCCTDEVHNDIKWRLSQVNRIYNGFLKIFLKEISKRFNTSSLEGKLLLAINTRPYKRNDMVEATVYTNGEFSLLDKDGNKIPYQIKSEREIDLASVDIETAMKGKKKLVKETKVIFKSEHVPSCGYKLLQIVEGKNENFSNENFSTDLKVMYNGMENKYFKVLINNNGSLDIHDKRTNVWYKGLNIFEDVGDSGDEYNYSPPKEDLRITTENNNAKIRLVHSGPYLATFLIINNIHIPMQLDHESDCRSNEKVTCIIKSLVSLKAESKRIEIKTTIENNAKDHRLRVIFKSPIKTDYSYAEQQFCVVKRPNIIKNSINWEKENYSEKPLPIYPQQSFVDINNGDFGLAIANKGLTEYEIINNSTIAITLLRCIGYLGKPNLSIRPGRVSGIERETPDSQMLGKYTFEYAIIPHKGDYIEGEVVKEAHEFITPVFTAQLTKKGTGNLKFEQSFIELFDRGLEISAIKKAEKENAIIIRLYNSTKGIITNAKIKIKDDRVKEAYVTDLKEDNQNNISKNGDIYIIPNINPYEIITLKFIIG